MLTVAAAELKGSGSRESIDMGPNGAKSHKHNHKPDLYNLLGREHYRQPRGPVLFIEGMKPGLYLRRCGLRTARRVIE